MYQNGTVKGLSFCTLPLGKRGDRLSHRYSEAQYMKGTCEIQTRLFSSFTLS